MGLDICVRRILQEPEDKEDYFRLIDEKGNYESKAFPEWTRPFEKDVIESWYDWDKFKEETGIDIDQCELHSESYEEDGCFAVLWPKSAGKYPSHKDFKLGDSYDWEKYEAAIKEHEIKIDLNKVPVYKKSIKVLYYEEVGYQRKGFNIKFYDDYRTGKIGYFVWTLKELKRYKKDYAENKKDFQANIIDNFIEGQDCVIFDW